MEIAKAQGAHTDIEPIIVSPVSGGSVLWSGNVEGVATHFVPVRPQVRAASLFYWDSLKLAAYARSLKPDLVHAHGTEDSAALAAARSGLPFMVTFQGVQALMKRSNPAPLFSRRTLQAIAEHIALRKTRFGVAKSQYGAREMAKLCPWIRLFEIPNTYARPRLEKLPSREPSTIAYAGTITPRKGLETLIGAVRELKPKHKAMRLVMYGSDATAKYAAGIVRELRSILGDSLVVEGLVPRIELEKGLASARVLVAPSLEEMFGNQVIDALLVETSVVASSDTPMAENVERFGNGSVFSRGSIPGLTTALDAVLSMPHDPTVAREAISRIAAYMGPERVGRLHSDAYRTTIEQWGNARG